MRKNKKVPNFKNNEEKFKFWTKHDSTPYVDYSKGEKGIFSGLKPSTKTISLRLPESMVQHLKVLANKRDVPYQSLMKIFLIDRIKKEFHSSGR